MVLKEEVVGRLGLYSTETLVCVVRLGSLGAGMGEWVGGVSRWEESCQTKNARPERDVRQGRA